ncbi:MAG TPA: protein translocase subunit SecF [Patescibacteria group bacterium]|nr:protein translocase subunit SecF [Patescibacteria group bacterium]
MNIIGLRKWWFIISGLIIIPGVIAMILWGFRLSVDFSGGTLLEITFPDRKAVTQTEIEKSLTPLNLEATQIQNTGSNSVIIRTKPLSSDQVNKIQENLKKDLGNVKETRLETVGPLVSKNLTQRAIIAVIVASIAIIFYIALAFRKVSAPANSFRFGICAVVALIHDLLFVGGVFAILGHFFGVEIDALFITALLTVMGFSVHDTIVVFDRIRENLKTSPELTFEQVANKSINQTLVRSLNTSLTVIFVLISLIIFGGQTLRFFTLALLIGILIGTYSSIFNASPLLVVWQNWTERKKLLRA